MNEVMEELSKDSQYNNVQFAKVKHLLLVIFPVTIYLFSALYLWIYKNGTCNYINSDYDVMIKYNGLNNPFMCNYGTVYKWCKETLIAIYMIKCKEMYGL